MSFIIKQNNLQPPTTQIETTEYIPATLPINDGDVSFWVFGASDGNGFGVGEQSLNGLVSNSNDEFFAGDIELINFTNNSIIVFDENDNFEFELNISITLLNTSNASRSYKFPTFYVRLPYTISGLDSSFSPSDSSKNIGLASVNTLAITMNDDTLNGNGEKVFTVQGRVVPSEETFTPITLQLSTNDLILPELSVNIDKLATSTNSLDIAVNHILGSENEHFIDTISFGILPSDIDSVYVNTNAQDNDFYGIFIEYDDSLEPTYLFNDLQGESAGKLNSVGRTVNIITGSESTTESPNADVVFINQDPIGSTIVVDGNNNTDASIEISLASSNFSPVPFRIRMVTRNEVNGVIEIKNWINDIGGDNEDDRRGLYINGETIVDDTISQGTRPFTYEVNINQENTTLDSSGNLVIILETDVANNGIYVETDRITYNVSKIGIPQVCPNQFNTSTTPVPLNQNSTGTNYGFFLRFTDSESILNFDDFNIFASRVPSGAEFPILLTAPELVVDRVGERLDYTLPLGSVENIVTVRIVPKPDSGLTCDEYIATLTINSDGDGNNPDILI